VILTLLAHAFASDLATLVEKRTLTFDSGQGDDAWTGVAVDSTGAFAVCGWETSAVAEEETTASLSRYDDAGLVWVATREGGALGDGRVDSGDGWNDVAVHPSTDEITVAGVQSGVPTNSWVVQTFAADATSPWEHVYTDGLLSLWQQAAGVAATETDIYATGTSWRNDTVAGRWLAFRYDAVTGAINLTPTVTYDVLGYTYATDAALDIEADIDGSFVVVGQRGIFDDGTAAMADTDGMIRKYDAAGVLLWEHSFGGDAGLADAATAVDIDVTGNVYVAGYVNAGTDNEGGKDLDWVVLKLDPDGYYGLGLVDWMTTWTAPGGGSEAALALVVDNEDHALVGGYQTDAYGVSQWRLAQHHFNDGVAISEKVWPASPGGGTVLGVDYRDLRWVAVGTSGNGTDTDGLLVELELDSDGDGVGDSLDGCDDDPDKVEAGVCGCGVPDIDSDGDLVLDCEDACPTNPDKVEEGVCGCAIPDDDRDGDGTVDCNDNCADDPNKTSPGVCGCNVPDDDTDGDGVLDCDDACSGTPQGMAVNEVGCEATEPPADTGAADDGPADSGCSCDVAPGAPALWPLLLGVALFGRRRLERV
jgi:MYXO-CTERM domain-containing protein